MMRAPNFNTLQAFVIKHRKMQQIRVFSSFNKGLKIKHENSSEWP